MGGKEFVLPSRVEDLFTPSSTDYYVRQVLTQRDVTSEVLNFKCSMYQDLDNYIVKHFDVYCNMLRHFNDFDADLKMTAVKVLFQAADKQLATIREVLDEDSNSLDEDTKFQFRNLVKMMVYLMCQFTHSLETDIVKSSISAGVRKGKKKSVAPKVYPAWPDERAKFIVTVKRLFKMPIRKLWTPPIVEYEFVNFVTNLFFKLLENVDVAKDKLVKPQIFSFLGTSLTEYKTGMGYCVTIIQMSQDFDHLPAILAGAVVEFVNRFSADSLIAELFREATLLDMSVLTQNLAAAHALSTLLVSVSEQCPEKALAAISAVLPFLDWESHVMRNCVLTILGCVICKALKNDNPSKKDEQNKEDILNYLERHVWDNNSYVRCRTIQILKLLLEEDALTSDQIGRIGRLIVERLFDKASNVRKNAMGFMCAFIIKNQFACQIPIEVLKESYKTENDKLKEMLKDNPESENETEAQPVARNGIILDSDDEEEDADKQPQASANNNSVNGGPSAADVNGDAAQDVPEETEEQQAIKTQKVLVAYLKSTLSFSEIILKTIKPVCQLLQFTTQTDVLEAVEFFSTTYRNGLKESEVGIKEVLKLIWNIDPVIKEAALNTFKSLYLTKVRNNSDADTVAKQLIHVISDCTTDQHVDIQEYVKHFVKSGDIPNSVFDVLWTNFAKSSNLPEKDRLCSLVLLSMAAEVQPDIISRHISGLMQIGLGPTGESSFQIAEQTFKALTKINKSTRNNPQAFESDAEDFRFPHDSMLAERIKFFLVNGIKNFDEEWVPMANQAVATMFVLISQPMPLCCEISIAIINLLNSEVNWDQLSNEEEPISSQGTMCFPNKLLCRFVAFSGHVALHYSTYMKTDYFSVLRKREHGRKKTHRKSTLNKSFPDSPDFSNKKRRRSFFKQSEVFAPIDEETISDQIEQICAANMQSDEKLVGLLAHIIQKVAVSALKGNCTEVSAHVSMSLAKFMLISEKFCDENMQLLVTFMRKGTEPYIRANIVTAMGNVMLSYPNVAEPWTPYLYDSLTDSSPAVRKAAIIIVTHLVLHDFVRIKGLISEVAKCIIDEDESIVKVAKYLFQELSKKGNSVYNILPDVISTLSDPKSGFPEEHFQIILKYLMQFIEKEKLVESLVGKLCARFTDNSNTDLQIHEITFCLSILKLNDKCFAKLTELKVFLKEKMADPVVQKYLTDIATNAKKNDAKTATELENFRKELGI